MTDSILQQFIHNAARLGLSEDEIEKHIQSYRLQHQDIDTQALYIPQMSAETLDYVEEELDVLLKESIWYLISPLIQASLPHKKPKGNEFTRSNGKLQLSILSPTSIGLPCGVPPRLLLMYICSQVKKTSERTILLGQSIRELLRTLDVPITTGKNGSVLRYTTELTRLLATSFTIIEDFDGVNHKRAGLNIKQAHIADDSILWKDKDALLSGASIYLSEQFYEAIKQTAVPLDAQAIKELKSSPMALDIYSWLTFRLKYLKKTQLVPWPALMQQLGAHYNETKTFKQNFIHSLKFVLKVYTNAKVQDHKRGLLIKPSPAHVPEKST